MKQLFLETGYFVDNVYMDSYIELIENSKSRTTSTNSQVHHILPRCYFLLVGEEVNNDISNLVVLLYKEHILAHYYLCLCSKGILRYKLENAFFMLCNLKKVEDFNPNDLDEYQKIYESIIDNRKGVSPPNKGKPMSEEQKRKISNTLKGHKVSEASREKMRQSSRNMSAEKRNNIIRASKNRNYRATEETKQKQSNSLKGHIVTEETRRKIGEGNKKQRGNQWFTDGVTCIVIHPGESIPEGFYRGTLRRGKHWFNNGIIELLAEEIPQGFVKGRLTNGK